MRTRTPEETAARQAQEPAPPAIPPLVTVISDPERWKRIEAAAQVMYPDGAALAVVRLALAEAGIPAPPTNNLLEFVQGMLRYGFRPVPTCLATPLPGSLFVTCGPDREPTAIGIVAKLHKQDGETQRDWFVQAASEDRKVSLASVEFFLLAPQSCRPCAERKQQATAPIQATG